MSDMDGYSGANMLQRQKFCVKCHSYVTFDKVNERQLACPLCKHRKSSTIHLDMPITLEGMQAIVDRHFEDKEKVLNKAK